MKIVKGHDYMVTGHGVEQFCLESYLWLTNQTPTSLSSDFDSHSFTDQIRLHSVI